MAHQQYTIAQQQKLISDLRELIAQRAAGEAAIPQQYADRTAELTKRFEDARDRLTREYETERDRIAGEYHSGRSAAEKEYDDGNLEVAKEHDTATKNIRDRHKKERENGKDARDRIRHKANLDFEEAKRTLLAELARNKQVCVQQRQGIADLSAEADNLIRSRKLRAPEPSAEVTPPPMTVGDPQQRYVECMTRGRELISSMEKITPARFIYEGWPVLVFIFASILLLVASGLVIGWDNWGLLAGISIGGSLFLSIMICAVTLPLAKRRTLHHYGDFRHSMSAAEASVLASFDRIKADFEPRYEALVAQRERKLHETTAEWDKTSAQLEAVRDRRLSDAAAEFDRRHREIETTRTRKLAHLDEKYPPILEKLRQSYGTQISDLTRKHEEELSASKSAYEATWREHQQRWFAGLAEIESTVDNLHEFCAEHFPDWNTLDFNAFKPSPSAPPALRFGRYEVQMADFPGGPPQHAELASPRTAYELPALLTFPESPSLLLKAEGDGRDEATRVIQNVMLRMLTSLPPGKVRFTIIDPTGRGQNFSAFMHLADFDEQLVTSRIWTESAHINRRLTDVTEHMETVIQKYLRNEFESIQAYNDHAGEVAEPYRVLVIANYPANFSEEAARRLVSICQSGPRCGVSTLISVDMQMASARRLDLSDLEKCAVTLNYENGRFVFQQPPLAQFPLEIEPPPSDATFTAAVRTVGKAAEDSSRVEVPFATVTPPEPDWWTGDSRSGIEVALGRAGATKLQYMRLGRGTSQHVLTAGKTGSGKSTLLNAMITNLATIYSPNELEFYLVDFKKGVEFKPYAAYRLPHARVIAVESEREFGLSVLERLDEELKRRGDLFRHANVQDLRAWRDAHPGQRMPRILLIVDEFQELFVSDDRVSRESTLLLDRLVRQGRAFGIHVILGTQTLAGAYSLARSTIGQMAVRIALQCSESDAHLILSEDNAAARLLSRPGAAVYNDANGLIEGNNPFQVVWLADFERESYLQRVANLAQERQVNLEPPIVFEGNVPSDPEANHLLAGLLTSGPSSPTAVGRAWLGASIAIKEPTSVSFGRHAGTNLLVVGQHDELALGVLSTSTVALAASGTKERTPEVFILDGTRPDEPDFGLWKRVARAIGDSAQVFEPRETTGAIEKISTLLAERTSSPDDHRPPVYLVIFNLARFRDLQKSDDDFGFSNFGEAEKVNTAKELAKILREGPPQGIHTLVWCDSYNNMNRWFDRQTLRDLGLRVLFQMSATDSSNIIDSPAGGNLGVNRAVLYDDERGLYERFRPYGRPSDPWLAQVRQTLAGRLS